MDIPRTYARPQPRQDSLSPGEAAQGPLTVAAATRGISDIVRARRDERSRFNAELDKAEAKAEAVNGLSMLDRQFAEMRDRSKELPRVDEKGETHSRILPEFDDAAQRLLNEIAGQLPKGGRAFRDAALQSLKSERAKYETLAEQRRIDWIESLNESTVTNLLAVNDTAAATQFITDQHEAGMMSAGDLKTYREKITKAQTLGPVVDDLIAGRYSEGHKKLTAATGLSSDERYRWRERLFEDEARVDREADERRTARQDDLAETYKRTAQEGDALDLAQLEQDRLYDRIRPDQYTTLQALELARRRGDQPIDAQTLKDVASIINQPGLSRSEKRRLAYEGRELTVSLVNRVEQLLEREAGDFRQKDKVTAFAVLENFFKVPSDVSKWDKQLYAETATNAMTEALEAMWAADLLSDDSTLTEFAREYIRDSKYNPKDVAPTSIWPGVLDASFQDASETAIRDALIATKERTNASWDVEDTLTRALKYQEDRR